MKIQLLLCGLLVLVLSRPGNLPAEELDKKASETASQPTAVQLGDLQVQVQSIKRRRQSLNVNLTFTNTGQKNLYVIAGTPQKVGNEWTIQKLSGSASDDLGNKYELIAVQGFTGAKVSYFAGTNLIMELAPTKSRSATFTLKGWRGGDQKDPTKVNLDLAFVILHDLKAEGSHQTQSLILKEQKID